MDRRAGLRRKSKHVEYPDHLRDFIDSIVLKEDNDPKQRMKRANEKRRKVETEKNTRKKVFNGLITEEDIIALGKSLKVEFPSGNISKPQTKEIVSKIFPRFDAGIVMKNIFQVFDTSNTGKIFPNELIWVFSMSIQGKVEEKLKWMFKLYDKDGNGEIDPEEMEDIFTKLCKEFTSDELYDEKNSWMIMISQKKRQGEELKKNLQKSTKKLKKKQFKKPQEYEKESDDEDRVEILKIVAQQLKDPQRDCKKFDPSKRAKEIFSALDLNGDGSVTEDEFISGCMSDEAFVKVIDEFSMDFIWSS
ncbi:S-modulin [Eurytemora carolleeae]|uniref:S-modulin n=1 Tax=Eurytemora carolleeae TaxID=1294199 RepID=UPI000C78000C|nr:S-modulin [Eurytemora carolleeae]|eukprot:XP_023320309.1 S-modulin-like [Eurytemora affinis]